MPLLRHLHRLRTRSALRAGGVVATLGALVFAGQAGFSASAPATYVVRSGDSLWAIATRNHITVSQLAAANGLVPGRILLIGTDLVIPSSSSTPATAASPAPATTTAAVGGKAFCSTFSFPGGVEALPAWLTDNPGRLALRPLFAQWAATYGINPALLEAVGWQESGWQEGAVSSAQAVGVGQLLPTTAQFVSQQLIGTQLSITSASDNIRMSARYLAYLQSVTGNWCMTIAAYNEGLTNLEAYGVLDQVVPYVTSVAQLIPQFTT